MRFISVVHQVYGYYMPTVNLMGAGAVQQAGKQAKLLGGDCQKAFVVKLEFDSKKVKTLGTQGF
jgi:hypothetical protein